MACPGTVAEKSKLGGDEMSAIRELLNLLIETLRLRVLFDLQIGK